MKKSFITTLLISTVFSNVVQARLDSHVLPDISKHLSSLVSYPNTFFIKGLTPAIEGEWNIDVFSGESMSSDESGKDLSNNLFVSRNFIPINVLTKSNKAESSRGVVKVEETGYKGYNRPIYFTKDQNENAKTSNSTTKSSSFVKPLVISEMPVAATKEQGDITSRRRNENNYSQRLNTTDISNPQTLRRNTEKTGEVNSVKDSPNTSLVSKRGINLTSAIHKSDDPVIFIKSQAGKQSSEDFGRQTETLVASNLSQVAIQKKETVTPVNGNFSQVTIQKKETAVDEISLVPPPPPPAPLLNQVRPKWMPNNPAANALFNAINGGNFQLRKTGAGSKTKEASFLDELKRKSSMRVAASGSVDFTIPKKNGQDQHDSLNSEIINYKNKLRPVERKEQPNNLVDETLLRKVAKIDASNPSENAKVSITQGISGIVSKAFLNGKPKLKETGNLELAQPTEQDEDRKLALARELEKIAIVKGQEAIEEVRKREESNKRAREASKNDYDAQKQLAKERQQREEAVKKEIGKRPQEKKEPDFKDQLQSMLAKLKPVRPNIDKNLDAKIDGVEVKDNKEVINISPIVPLEEIKVEPQKLEIQQIYVPEPLKIEALNLVEDKGHPNFVDLLQQRKTRVLEALKKYSEFFKYNEEQFMDIENSILLGQEKFIDWIEEEIKEAEDYNPDWGDVYETGEEFLIELKKQLNAKDLQPQEDIKLNYKNLMAKALGFPGDNKPEKVATVTRGSIKNLSAFAKVQSLLGGTAPEEPKVEEINILSKQPPINQGHNDPLTVIEQGFIPPPPPLPLPGTNKKVENVPVIEPEFKDKPIEQHHVLVEHQKPKLDVNELEHVNFMKQAMSSRRKFLVDDSDDEDDDY